MYSKEQTQKLQKSTSAFIKKMKNGGIDKKEVKELRDILRFHEYRYYILNDPLISDYEYDHLYKSLEKIEKENPGLITADSPTQRVAKELTKEFPQVQHLVPMLSLDNSYNSEDLVDFDRRARELATVNEIEYCIEPKFDGAGISLVYEDDILVRGATRGDGVKGDDITTNIKQIKSIPLSAKFSEHSIRQIEIRGEILINKNNFKEYNEQMAEQNLPPLANPRNAAAGTLRMKDPRIVAERNLEGFLYQISYFTTTHKKDTVFKYHSDTISLLWELGFRSPEKEKKVVTG